MTYYTTTTSPIGDLLLTSNGRALTGLHMAPFEPPPGWHRDESPFEDVVAQLAAYFSGVRRTFDVVIDATGTPFQQRVWEALREIPYGETISYGELARRIGNPKTVRAVGRANGANPIAVIVPCHRVIGTDGTLTGYGGGLDRKARLLALEGSRSGRGTHESRCEQRLSAVRPNPAVTPSSRAFGLPTRAHPNPGPAA